eukprot:3414856-Alexandrium_andersonii.AAC.1
MADCARAAVPRGRGARGQAALELLRTAAGVHLEPDATARGAAVSSWEKHCQSLPALERHRTMTESCLGPHVIRGSAW